MPTAVTIRDSQGHANKKEKREKDGEERREILLEKRKVTPKAGREE